MKHGPKNKSNAATSLRHELQRILSQAVALHQAGDIQQAQALYLKILGEDPEHAEALHMLGAIALQVGRFDLAEKFISHAIRNNGKAAIFHNNLGNALRGQGKIDEAVSHYHQALKLNRSYPEALNNLGTALLDQGKPEQAADQFRQALRLKPNYALALINLGNALQQQDKLEPAVDAYRRALHINPKSSGCLCNLGTALQNLARQGEAIEAFNESLRLEPANSHALNGLGIAYRTKGMAREAIECFENALRLSPDYAEAHYNYSLALLQAGILKQGWTEYEWRLQQNDAAERLRDFHQPWWNGENLAAKVLLIWGEQGVGDEILFASVIPDAVSAAAHCVVECDQRLVALFARSFPRAEVIPRSLPHHPRADQADIDRQTPAGGLCRWFRGDLGRFSGHKGYLLPDPDRVAFWKARLAALGEDLKVGICWRSMLRSAARSKAYTELVQWEPILAVPGVVFINLQYDNCDAELAVARQRFGTVIHQWNDIDLLNNLDDAAALTSALDLVISPSTSVAAMAGALGVKVWQLSPPGNWATLGTDRIPWYPSMKVFPHGDGELWETTIQSVALELQRCR